MSCNAKRTERESAAKAVAKRGVEAMTVPAYTRAALSRFGIWATTDTEEHAAAITQRLLNEGRDATYWSVSDLLAAGYTIRTSFKYAVLAERLEPHHGADFIPHVGEDS